jgi:ArsR family transcriptional regulator
MDDHMTVLKTLADPTRLKIFKLVLNEELCGCELQELLQISQPAISQHVAKLKLAGLIKERRAGMWTYYRGDLVRVTAQLGEFMSFLAADPATLPEMADLMERRAGLNRAELCCDRKGERQT